MHKINGILVLNARITFVGHTATAIHLFPLLSLNNSKCVCEWVPLPMLMVMCIYFSFKTKIGNWCQKEKKNVHINDKISLMVAWMRIAFARITIIHIENKTTIIVLMEMAWNFPKNKKRNVKVNTGINRSHSAISSTVLPLSRIILYKMYTSAIVVKNCHLCKIKFSEECNVMRVKTLSGMKLVKLNI